MSIPHNCIGSPCLICNPNQRIYGLSPEPTIDCNPWRPHEETVPAKQQCMECKGYGLIILGRADSQVRSRGIVQCAECRFWFHTDCILRHFETDAAKRIVDLELAIKVRDDKLEWLIGQAIANEREACKKAAADAIQARK